MVKRIACQLAQVNENLTGNFDSKQRSKNKYACISLKFCNVKQQWTDNEL